MEQNISNLLMDDRDQLIKKALVDNDLISELKIERIISSHNKLINSAKKEIQGKCYTINYFEKKFIVFDTYTDEILQSIDLPGNIQNQTEFRYDPEEWELWGTSYAIIDLEELNKEGDIFFDKENLFGLTIVNDSEDVYLYNSQIYKQRLLANTSQFIFGARSKIKNTYLPFDMVISPDKKFLLLMNRGEGKVYFYDINLEAFTREIIVRSAGSNKSVNAAISLKNDKIYFTDNVSPILGIYDLTQQNYESENIGIGILGNIVLAPDEKSFYVIVTRPESSIKQLSFNKFEEIKEFPLKGELFSQLGDPCDLMTFSPDKKFLAFMTYIDIPTPQIPVVTIIDLEKNKAVKRFSIKDDTKPVNITFGCFNPVGILNKTLEDLIREEDIIESERLDEIISNLYQSDEEEENKELVEVKNQIYDFEVDTNEIQEINEFTPKKTKHVIMSPKVDKYIIEVLLGGFWQKHDIDLTEYPEAQEKLNELAETIRKKLEFYDSYIVNINNFFDNKSLNAIILREYILEMFSEEESKKRTELQTTPSKCLNCSSNLMGSWDCLVCGFKMEKPEDIFRRKSASFDHLTNLQKGNFFIIDSENSVLVEMDQYRNQSWKLPLKDINISSITNAYRLENKNNLILDKEQSKIVEISYKGRFVWEYKSKKNDPELSSPNNFTMLNDNNLLIADTGNNRVFETDLEGNLIWEYIDDLYKPYDIQKTYDETYLVTDYGNNRVLEFSRIHDIEKNTFEFNLIWQYGNSLNINYGGVGTGDNELNKPISAFKEIDGNYLIIDSGNKRIIVVNENKDIVWEYKTQQDDESISISNPLRVTRLKNQDLIIVGDNKVIQLMPLENNKIKWASKIDELGDKTKSITLKDGNPNNKSKPVINEKPIKKSPEIKEKVVEPEKPKKKEESRKPDKKQEPKDIEDEYLIEENEPETKKVKSNQYIKDSRDIKEEETLEEAKKEEIKKVNANQYTRDSRDVKEDEEVIEEAKTEIKKVNARQYIGDSRNHDEEVIEDIPVKANQENEKLNAIIEEKKRLLAIELSNKSNNIEHPKAEKLISFPILVADKSKNMVSVIKRSGEAIWSYGLEENEKINTLIFAELTVNKTVLVTEKERVIELSLNPKKVIWEFPCSATNAVRLKNGNTLITDKQNLRVIEVNTNKEIIWEYKENNMMNQPYSATRLNNGNTLITCNISSKIKEINPEKELVWSFGGLSFPEYSCRLKNGNTLIADTTNSRVIEVTEDKEIIWSYSGDATNKLVNPSYAIRLVDGHTFIIYFNNKKMIEVDNSGKEYWQYIN